MQFKLITTILVLLLVIASLLAAGCTDTGLEIRAYQGYTLQSGYKDISVYVNNKGSKDVTLKDLAFYKDGVKSSDTTGTYGLSEFSITVKPGESQTMHFLFTPSNVPDTMKYNDGASKSIPASSSEI